MTDSARPRTIALATDLSHRSDRALDRAISLARKWNARLLVIHAVEERNDTYPESRASLPGWRRPPDPAKAMRERLQQDMEHEDPAVDIELVVQTGSPASVVLEAAQEADAGLIITGVARDETLGRLILGDTVDQLLRKSPLPMLVVRRRVYKPYREMVVATDFSPSAHTALETALSLFGEAHLSIFHAYDVPFAGYLNRSDLAGEFDEYGQEAVDKLLQEVGLPPEKARSVTRLIEHGAPDILLRNYQTHLNDVLYVVGTHGGGLLYRTFIGSIARRIIDAVESDVLVVPDKGKREE